MYKALTLPLIATLVLHGLLLAALLITMPDTSPRIKAPSLKYVDAKLVTMERPKAKPVKAASPKPKPKSVEKPTPPPAPKVDPSEARKKEQAAALARKAVAEKNAKAQQQAKRELEVKQQREAEARSQREAEAELAAALDQDYAQQQLDNDAAVANSYIALITQTIKKNWNRPPSARNNMEAELDLRLVPTGEVVSVRVVRSSGNAAFDRSAEQAVLKAGRFPELQQLPAKVFEKNFRRLTLMFRPEDLRL